MFRAAVEEMLREDPHLAVEQINEGLQRAAMQYNRRPQRELGGLSPERVRLLLQDPWDGAGVLTLYEGIPHRDLAGVRIVRNAKAMLGYLEETGEIPATATRGHFTRQALAEIAPRLTWPDDYLWEGLLSRRGNEEDYSPIHVLRLLLGLAGLMKMRKRRFSLTARGRKLLQEDRAGELFALLFHTQFREMNLAYLWSYGPPLSSLQHTLAFTLFRLGRVASDWKTPQRLLPETLLPPVIEELSDLPSWINTGAILAGRVLQPLAEFGLLHVKTTQSRERHRTVRHFRKSALYDRFLRFSFPR